MKIFDFLFFVDLKNNYLLTELIVAMYWVIIAYG